MKRNGYKAVLVLAVIAFSPWSLLAGKFDIGGGTKSKTTSVDIGPGGQKKVNDASTYGAQGTRNQGTRVTIPITINGGGAKTSLRQPGKRHAPTTPGTTVFAATQAATPKVVDPEAAAKTAEIIETVRASAKPEASSAKTEDQPSVVPIRSMVNLEATSSKGPVTLSEAFESAKTKSYGSDELANPRVESGITKDSAALKSMEAEIERLALLTGIPRAEIEKMIDEAQIITAQRKQVFNIEKMREGMNELMAAYATHRPTVDAAFNKVAQQLGISKLEALTSWLQFHTMNGQGGIFQTGARQLGKLEGNALVGSLIWKSGMGHSARQFRAEGLSPHAAFRRARAAMSQFALSRRADPEKVEGCVRAAA